MSVATSTAIIGGAVIGAGTSLAAAAAQSSAADDATQAQLTAQDRAIAAQREQFERGLAFQKEQSEYGRKTLEPFLAAQRGGVSRLEAFADPNNPLYDQEREQATRQIQMQLASQGLLRSRGQGDALANLELGLTRERLGVNRGLAGLGAAENLAGGAQAYGQSGSSLLAALGERLGSSFAQRGDIEAGGIRNRAGGLAGGISGVGGAIQGGIGNLLTQRQNERQLALLKEYLGGGNSGF